MSFALQLFLVVNTFVWVAQAYLDVTRKHIQLLYIVPVLLSTILIGFNVSLISFGLLTLAPILYLSGLMAVGDTTLYITYVISTTIYPLLGIQALIYSTAAYILLQETVLDNQKYAMAPAPTTAFAITYLLGLLL